MPKDLRMRALSAIPASLVLATFLAPLDAQVPTASVSALTPLVVRITNASGSTSAIQPAGPLATIGQLAVVSPTTSGHSASVSWGSQVSTTRAVIYLFHYIACLQGPAISGGVGPHEFLLEFDVPFLAPSNLRVFRETSSTPGFPGPSVQLDLGNDGSIDVSSIGQFGWIAPVPTFGSQPLLIRVLVSESIGVGGSGTNLWFTVTPDNDLSVTQVSYGCSTTWPLRFDVEAAFSDRGVDVLYLQSLTEPTLVVMGFTPLMLPLPCMLWPSVDILSYEPTGLLHVPLPAAVRPVALFVQGVTLRPTNLTTTVAHRIDAF